MRIVTFENGVRVVKEVDALEPSVVSPEQVRGQRDALLSASDWTQIADAPVNQAAWAAYRQALRDVPAQAGFPADVIWPTPPV